jgi:hypothetical protein
VAQERGEERRRRLVEGADDWKRAVEFAEESQLEEARERQKFCAKFSDAREGADEPQLAAGAGALQGAREQSRGQSATIDTEIRTPRSR